MGDDGKTGASGEQDDNQDQNQRQDGGGEGNADGGSGGDGEQDYGNPSDEELAQWAPEKVKGYVQKLRKQNAKERTEKKQLKQELGKATLELEGFKKKVKSVAGEGDDGDGEGGDPEPDTSGANYFEWRSQVQELAIEHGIGKDSYEYFEHLMEKKALEQGAAFDDDDVTEVVEKVRSVFGQKRGGSTSVGSGGKGKGGQADGGNSGGDITPESFSKLSMNDRIALRARNPELYKRVFNEAAAKKLL